MKPKVVPLKSGVLDPQFRRHHSGVKLESTKLAYITYLLRVPSKFPRRLFLTEPESINYQPFRSYALSKY